jgi:antitoxin ParD1/3/4
MAQQTESITVTLPPETSARIRAKIASGEFSNEIEVIRQGIDSLSETPPLEPWQLKEVLDICAELDADPSLVVTEEELDASLRAEFDRLQKEADAL